MPNCAPYTATSCFRSEYSSSIDSRPTTFKPNDKSWMNTYSCSFFPVVAVVVAAVSAGLSTGVAFCAATFAFRVRCLSEQALQVRFVRL